MSGITQLKLDQVNKQISEAAARNFKQKVKLICVSKTFSSDVIFEAQKFGLIDFGENYVQEWEEKSKIIKNVNWHFIGRLQSNKLKNILGKCKFIHSIDRKELFLKAVQICQKEKISQDILLQVNVANEDSKAGFSKAEVQEFLPEIFKQTHLKVVGFMTMPPLQNKPEQNRAHFAKLRNLRDQLKRYSNQVHTLAELSMGTSQDFTVAIEEGSTMVRLGTILLGDRTQESE